MKRFLLVCMVLFMCFVSYSVVYADLTDGLAAYYPFDGNADDQSGNNNNGVEYGGIQYKQGIIGDSASFDGVDDYISVPSNSTLNPVDQLSISFWVKVDDFTNVWSPIVHKGGPRTSGLTNREYTVWLRSNSSFRLASAGNSSSHHTVNACCVGLGWTHYVGIIDRQNHHMKIYVDGILEADTIDSYSTFNNNDYDLIFGWSEEVHNQHSPFKGRLDEVRIYNRVLTEDEIKVLSDEHSTLLFKYQAPDNPIEERFSIKSGGPTQVIGPIENDMGYSAWSLSSSTRRSQFSYKSGPLSQKEKTKVTNEGFSLTFRARVSQGNAPAYDAGSKTVIGHARLGDGSKRYQVFLGINSSGNTVAVLVTYLDAAGPGSSIRGFGPSYTLNDAGYHTYELVFNPQTQSASLFIDGIERISGYKGYTRYTVNDGVVFGAHSGGSMNFNFVQLAMPADREELGSDLIGDTITIPPNHEFSLEQNTQKNVSVQVFNDSDQQQSATLEILSPHSDDLTFSLTQQDPITLAPGDVFDIPIVIDASSASVRVYDDILLKVAVENGETLYSNIKVTVLEQGAPDLPDLSLRADDIQLTDYILGTSATLKAVIHNNGLLPASEVQVQFYKFGSLLGETVLDEVPSKGIKEAAITAPITSTGEHLIQVVIDSSEAIQELSETNNEASKIITLSSGGGPTGGYILVTGSLPRQVYTGSSFNITGHAVYDLYINGIRNTDYVVKGGPVQITIKGDGDTQWVYGGVHTNVNGNFSKYLQAPLTPGNYRILMTVTDKTFVGKRELVFSVVERPVTPPPPPSPPTTIGTGTWNYEPVSGTWNWVWTKPPVYDIASDLRVFSENIYFSNTNPEPNEEITITAEILYWSNSTDISAQNVPVNFYVTYPGTEKMKIGETLIKNISVGEPDFGSRYVYTTWKNQAQGIYIIEVEIDPSYVEENMLNNAATRAIIAGQLSSPLTGVISGQVTDPLGGVADVMIELYDSSGTTFLENRFTDETGYYLFEDVPVDDYQVHIVTPDDYQVDAETKPAEVIEQSVTEVDFHLTKQEAPDLVIDLNPANAVNDLALGEYDHTVTARIMDSQNNPQQDIAVTFTINGVNTEADGICNPTDCATDANGEVTFTYSNTLHVTGTDTITAYFTDQAGQVITSQAVTKDWIMTNIPPEADAGSDQTSFAGDQVTLDGSGSTDPDGGPSPLSYSWTFQTLPSESGLTDTDIVNADQPDASFVPDAAGIYRLKLQVSDGQDSDEDEVEMVVSKKNIAPTAEAGDDLTVQIGEDVVLDGSGSSDPDNGPQPLSFAWRFVQVPDLSTLTDADIQGAVSATPSFTPDSAGTYLLELEVSDGEASDSDNVMVTVKEPSVLEPVKNLYARPKDGKVDLTWTPVSDAVSYNIYRRVENELYAPVKEGHITDYAAYADYGLTNGVTYFYTVRWVGANGIESPDSHEVSATPKERVR